jgi:hypothetical protein
MLGKCSTPELQTNLINVSSNENISLNPDVLSLHSYSSTTPLASLYTITMAVNIVTPFYTNHMYPSQHSSYFTFNSHELIQIPLPQ